MRIVWLAALTTLPLGCGTSPEFVDVGGYDAAETEMIVEGRSETADGELIGRWEGVGYQSGGHDWYMELDITRVDPGPCAVVRYPSLGCAGYWECSRTRGNRIVAVERITRGSSCHDRVDVEVQLADGVLSFAAAVDDISATAKLSRTR